MIYGRTHLHEFTRDDGSVVVIEYKRSDYHPAVMPDFNDPGSPADGGEITALEVDNGTVTLTEAEYDRAEREIYDLPWDAYEAEYYDDI